MAEAHHHNHHHRNNITTARALPHDVILFHVVPRLPAKTAIRFRSVCKEWCLFLKTRVFYDLHHHHVTTILHHHKLPLLPIDTTPCDFFSMDCQEPFKSSSLTVPFQKKDCENMSVITSCNGMVCIGMKKRSYDHEYADLVLWNPVTSEYKTLSKANSHRECYEETYAGFTMYYSSSEDDYRLLRVTESRNAYIYSLKSDSWRTIESTEKARDWNFDRWMPSVVLNEKVYFLNQYRRKVWIIRFDTKTEKFKKIATPSFRKQKPECWSFGVERGCIHLHVRNLYNGRIDLWRMNGDGGWMKVETYLPKSSLNWYLKPLHLMRNGNWLMHFGGYLYNVDMEKYINGDEDFDSLNSDGMLIWDEGIYFETFVSPNRYIK